MADGRFAFVFVTLAYLHQAQLASSDEAYCSSGELCTRINECKSIQEEIHDDDSVYFICGFDKLTVKVCCPAENLNQRLFPQDICGVATDDRITNGQNATLGQFPWMALLGFKGQNSQKVEFQCGGTLINSRYVLTAAHCTKIQNATLTTVRLGETDLSSDNDCDRGYCSDKVLDIAVEDVIVHESYNTPYLKNDIALVRLGEHIPVSNFTDYVKPICLPFAINTTDDKNFTVAGWGKTHYGNKGGSDFLQFVTVQGRTHEDCEYSQSEEVRPLAESQLCASGNRRQEACKGDSGGPLMDVFVAPTSVLPQIYQIGIVSFGAIRCGEEPTPTVYTRVSSYLDWILHNIRD